MKKLKLTARCESRNPRHATIGVFQNGGKAGVLTVDADQEDAVLAAINCHADLVESLDIATVVIGSLLAGTDIPRELLDMRALLEKVKGKPNGP